MPANAPMPKLRSSRNSKAARVVMATKPAANTGRKSDGSSSSRSIDPDGSSSSMEIDIKEEISSPSTSCSSLPGLGAVPHNWQASKATLKERMKFLLGSDVLADVHFLVGRPGDSAPGPGISGERKRIPAHKFVLAAGSSVFDAMFNGPLAEGAASVGGRARDGACQADIPLPDIEPAAFMAMLSFLYTDEVEIEPENVMTTLYTAKKYAVPALECRCVDFLKKNLNSSNAFLLLTQARLFDEPQLAELCLDAIDKHTTDAVQAEGFVEIDLDTLCCVLQRDTLRIAEVKLFQAVLSWTETQCARRRLALTPENQRVVLNRALDLIRFPLMSVEEFATGPAQSQILTDRDVINIFLYFTVNPKPKVRFNDTPRCCMIGKEMSVVRFREVQSRWGYSGTSDRIRFVVDRRIFVIGYGLYGSIHGSQEYEVCISLCRTGASKNLATNETTFSCDGSTNLFKVLFKEPVEIQPNVSYTACAALKGPDSYYGTNGRTKASVDSPTVGKITFHFTFAAGNNNGTSVDDGQIPEILFYV